MQEAMASTEKGALARFASAVHDQRPVAGLTHNFYRYPARFSPLFARSAIEAFSRPGDVVLDPFMGGATTLVEARTLGRHAVGSDISSLSVFLARVKTMPLSDAELRRVGDWLSGLADHLNLHLPSVRASDWQQAGYQRNLPWPIRKTMELAMARIEELPSRREQRFARCVLLRAGQWALDCRQRVPSASAVRSQLHQIFNEFVTGMREYRTAVRNAASSYAAKVRTIPIHCAAADLPARSVIASLPRKPRLVITSPPYPGVHVLYHRWNVRGRKESPAPFWIADCLDGLGAAHYTFGDRKQAGLKSYFVGIRNSFTALRSIIAIDALLVQMVAFSEPKWQIPAFLNSMYDAGFNEVLPEALGLPIKGRLWRSVPGRRWFALIKGDLPTSDELVLFHRPK